MINLLTGQNGKDERVELVLTRAEQMADQANRLQERVRQLQAENRKLRRLTHMAAHVRTVRKAHEAALKLAALYLAGFRTGRGSAQVVGGVSERSYFLGRAMLQLASVYANGEFMTDDPELIEANLTAAAKSAERDFWLLLRRIPPSRRPKL